MESKVSIPEATTQTIISKLLEIVNLYRDKGDMDETDFSCMTNSIYKTIDSRCTEFVKNKTEFCVGL